MERVIMKCGCVAQGVVTAIRGEKLPEPIPGCMVHDCYEKADAAPDLTGRTAECSYLPKGHAIKPSSLDLAFFEFCGEGSRIATEICKCGFHRVAHDDSGRIAPRKVAGLRNGCAGFTAKGPQERDKYYCGCHGWN